MLRLKIQFFAEPADVGGNPGAAGDNAAPGGADGAGANPAENGADGADNPCAEEQKNESNPENLNDEIARLKAEIARQKSAVDKATKEAAEAKRNLKAKMTAEEIAAKEKEEADEAQKNRIIELEKQVAKTNTVKTVMGKLGLDEDSAGNLADHLYGAADIENALLEIQKAWQAKEAALRKEFGKITGPGAGADSNSPEAQAIRRAAELGKKRNAQTEQAQKAMQAYMR